MKKNQNKALCDASECINSNVNVGEVVSLSEMRTPGHLDAIREHLIALLTDLYDTGIAVHNQMISRSRVSVLSELTIRINVYFDLVPQDLRSSVLTPFALYGGAVSEVYGKDVLQQRNRRQVTERESADLLASLQDNPYQLWCYHHDAERELDYAHPLVGPDQHESIEIAGVLTRAGEVTRESGYYSGWPLHFEGFWFLVCGTPHDERTAEIVKRKSERIEAETAEEFWAEFELPMVHLLVDPIGSRYRSSNPAGSSGLWKDEYKPSRRTIIHRVQDAIEEDFLKGSELTSYGQLAEIAKNELERAEFVECVTDELEDVLLASRGMRRGQDAVGVADILAKYQMTADGVLKGTDGILQHPIGVLLLDEEFYLKTSLDRLAPIRDGLKWARSQSLEHPGALAFRAAWRRYQREQFWLAVHGFAVGSTEPMGQIWSKLGHPGFISDINRIFDERFLKARIDALPLGRGVMNRFIRSHADERGLGMDITVADLPLYDYGLLVRGVGKTTAEGVIIGLLEHGRQWRWDEAGLDYRDYSGLKDGASADSEAVAELSAGLDDLADLFG